MLTNNNYKEEITITIRKEITVTTIEVYIVTNSNKKQNYYKKEKLTSWKALSC